MSCKSAWFEREDLNKKSTFCMRTIPNTSSHLKRLDEVITTEFIPAVTDEVNCSDIEN